MKNSKNNDLLIISSNLVPSICAGYGYLTPAQLAVLWEIASWLRINRKTIATLMAHQE